MTSNMGSELILENFEDLEALGDKHRADIIETTKIEVFEKLKENLRPEFLNRIDEKIMFLPLTKEEIKKIAGLQLRSLTKNLKAQGIDIEISEKALNLLSDLGYEPQFGARPLKRVIQKEIINELAKLMLGGDLIQDGKLMVDADQKGFVFNGKSIGISTQKPEERAKQLNELTKATKDLEDAAKAVNGEDKEE